MSYSASLLVEVSILMLGALFHYRHVHFTVRHYTQSPTPQPVYSPCVRHLIEERAE